MQQCDDVATSRCEHLKNVAIKPCLQNWCCAASDLKLEANPFNVSQNCNLT